MLLSPLRHTEDVAQQDRLLWDCQARVLVEPPQVSMAENTPFALESLLAAGQDEQRAGLCLCPRFEGLGHDKRTSLDLGDKLSGTIWKMVMFMVGVVRGVRKYPRVVQVFLKDGADDHNH